LFGRKNLRQSDGLHFISDSLDKEGCLKSLEKDEANQKESQPYMSAILNRKLDRSNELWAEAQDTILSGCQLYSKGTETHIKGVSPIYIDHGKDAHVWDVDGTEYIDYDMGMGPVLLGYQYKAVDDAVVAQLRRGIPSRKARDDRIVVRSVKVVHDIVDHLVDDVDGAAVDVDEDVHTVLFELMRSDFHYFSFITHQV